MLFQYTHFPSCVTVVNIKRNFSHTFPKKKILKIIIDYFKGLLMTHNLDIFMSGKNLRLNGLIFLIVES